MLKPDITVGGVIAGYTFMTPKKILGGGYGLSFLVPVLNTRFNSNLFDASAQTAGLSDVFLEPILLGWEKGRANYTVNYGFWAPSGDFNPSLPMNPGLGFWEQQIQWPAQPWASTKKKLWNTSLLKQHGDQQSKSGLDLKPGPIFTGEYSFGRRFFKYQMNAGVSGYYSQKLAADTGSGVSPATKGLLDHSFAVGPEVEVHNGRQTSPCHHDIRYEQQFGVELQHLWEDLVLPVPYLPPLPSATCEIGSVLPIGDTPRGTPC